jgi:3',5'-cyclic AMP phosphodiesterase CpdA
VRIAHATDIHWFVPPTLGRLLNKRLIGTANLYLAGRRHHFDRRAQRALVEAIAAQQPDALVITGDLTAQALPEEFALARAELAPVLDAWPTLIQCGNHDVYTRGARREGRLQATFGAWMHPTPAGIARLDAGDLTVLGLDPNRPHLLASGYVPDDQLHALAEALRTLPPERSLLLALHYPLLDRRGAVYDGLEHGLRNARALIEVLRAAPRRPDLIVHGHVHHGFRTELDLGDTRVPVFDPGSGGYAWLPDQDRAGCFNVYDLQPGQPVQVERFRFDGERFTPEPGGAYATGR